MKTVKYGKLHKSIMLKCGKTLVDVQKLDMAQQQEFIDRHLSEFLNSDLDDVREAADQLVDMIKYWEVGQTEETYS